MPVLRDGSTLATMIAQHGKGIRDEVSWEGNKILLIGSVFSNRGDQAMTYTAVDQLSRRFPRKEIVLLTTHPEQIPNPSKYEFEVLPLDPTLRARSLNPIGKVAGLIKSEPFEKFEQTWKDAAFAIDINGYVLSSQTGLDDTLSYILTLMVADTYGVPYYILPQSIGPFNFNRFEHFLVDPLLRKYIETPQLIFPREEHGVKSLRPYTDRKIEQSSDIVIQHSEYDLNNVFTDQPKIDVPEINEKTVGIIPNGRVFQRINEKEMLRTYSTIGEQLNDLGYQICILSHTTGDTKWCEEIHDAIGFGERIDGSYSAIELERIIDQFDFMVGSRYHSVIHAYKNSVPTIVIGWAVKYKELLQRFKQSAYYFDCRTRLNEDEICEAIEHMSSRIDKEGSVIKSIREEIQETSVFDKVESDIQSKLE